MAEDIDFKYPMKKSCAWEMSQFCKNVPHGHARVVRCALGSAGGAGDWAEVCAGWHAGVAKRPAQGTQQGAHAGWVLTSWSHIFCVLLLRQSWLRTWHPCQLSCQLRLHPATGS